MTSSHNKFEKQFLIRNMHDREGLIDCYRIQGSTDYNRLVQTKRFGPVLRPNRTRIKPNLEILDQVWRFVDPWLCQRRNVHDLKMILISNLVIIVGICSSIFLSFRIVKIRSRLNILNSSLVNNKPWVIYLFNFHAKRKSSVLELSAWSLAYLVANMSKFGESLYDGIISSESRKSKPGFLVLFCHRIRQFFDILIRTKGRRWGRLPMKS